MREEQKTMERWQKEKAETQPKTSWRQVLERSKRRLLDELVSELEHLLGTIFRQPMGPQEHSRILNQMHFIRRYRVADEIGAALFEAQSLLEELEQYKPVNPALNV